MMAQQSSKGRRLLAGGVLAVTGSVGLIAFPLLSRLSFLSESVVFSLVIVLAVLTGIGVTVAVFSLKGS